MKHNPAATKFLFIANNLSIDFVNTLIVAKGQPVDLLTTATDLLVWTVSANIIKENTAEKFAEISAKEQNDFLDKAKDFRKLLLVMIKSIIQNGQVASGTVNEINKLLRQKKGYEEIVETEQGFTKRYNLNHQKITTLLIPIAESASDLLCQSDWKLIKKCEAQDCVLYFYDTNKDHNRRWCRMNACGNKAKAAAFYQRKKVSK